MFGGGANGNTVFPGFGEENCGPCDNNTLPQLQLFGRVPLNVGSTNYTSNKCAPSNNGAMKRVRESDPVYMQQKLHISLNKTYCHDEVGTLINPNDVSTGLRLSSSEEERNSSITFAGESMKNVIPGVHSFGNGLKMEMDRQTEEFGRYIKLQEENILKGVRELNQRHTFSLLNALERGVNKKLHEKDLEIQNINRKNQELSDQIKQVSIDAQSWHYKAKYNESVVHVLKNNIQQLTAQGTTQAREGSGDSEIEDAVSCTNDPLNQRLRCRSCNGKEVSILLLPCRHLCVCTDCEGFVDICPICRVRKIESVLVYM